MGDLNQPTVYIDQESKYTHDPGWLSESSGYLAKRARVTLGVQTYSRPSVPDTLDGLTGFFRDG